MRCPPALAPLLLWGFLCVTRAPPGALAAPTLPHAIPSFPAPGEVIEVLAPDQPLPYVPLLPDMRVEHWRLDSDIVEPAPPPLRLAYIGPPLLRLDYVYGGRSRPAPRLITDTYRRALTQAGWELSALPGAPADAIARYTRNGRALWLKLHGDPRALHLALWEPAAHARTAVLREALAQKGQVAVYGILFELNKDNLRPEAEPILRQILMLLQETPTLKLEIQVHTDDSFRNVWGRSPSRNRAHEIVRWLVAHGIAAARLVAQGYGESKPVASNRTPEGRARNRRVELFQLPSPPAP